MNKITTLFFDIGGVCLSNGWDRLARKRSADHFSFDLEEFEKHHQEIINKFRTNEISLNDYLNKVLFFKDRSFTKNEFTEFMKAQSKPINQTLLLIEQINKMKKYVVSALNNESFELNLYRINKFNLYKLFSNFFSSCFLRMNKPDKEIYTTALNILHKKPSECFFIDDRIENIYPAASIGMNVIHYQDEVQLKNELEKNGII